MDQDSAPDVLPSDDETRRRSFGGLGRGPAALLLAAGLLIGGGVTSFVVASAASTVSPSQSASLATTHHCPNAGATRAT
jgi:hypothetical protein